MEKVRTRKRHFSLVNKGPEPDVGLLPFIPPDYESRSSSTSIQADHSSNKILPHRKVKRSPNRIMDYYQHVKDYLNFSGQDKKEVTKNKKMDADVTVTEGYYDDMEVQKDGLSEAELDKLVILIEQAFNNRRCIRGNPTSTEWPLIIKSMNGMFKKVFRLYKVKNKWKKHREKWRKFNEILNYSGVGWNSRECTIDASEEFWADILKV
ncbi:hypothetical protein AXF42_Ash021573 [Apostasia shenzhenica]|uniref:Myb/SANT-like domain-containing protein n=1 Tax=Apostasia shenzhenica TaxID=1088818 RepID=A0A2H9ZY35_9ASPA|nr:hypothetical protein AXF42_Ash021573 [Apostasia shenzhenica]